MPEKQATTTFIYPDKGRLTFDAEGTEGGKYHSRKLHVPGASSGLTIGRGYDMSVTTTTFNPGAAIAQARSLGGTAVDMTVTTALNSTTDSSDVTATGGTGGAIGDPAGVHLTVEAEL